MSTRALAGGYGPAQKDGSKRSRTTQAPPDPRDFALAVMRDESQPMALRAQMAKAVLPYAHKRGEEMEAEEKPQRRKYSDLELARRIAHIMALGRQQAEREGKPFPEIGDEDIAPEPVPGGRPRGGPSPRRSGFGRAGGPPDWENSRAVVHPAVSTPPAAPSAATAPHGPPHPPRIRSAPSPRRRREGTQNTAQTQWSDDEGRRRADAYDPHPGYRWI